MNYPLPAKLAFRGPTFRFHTSPPEEMTLTLGDLKLPSRLKSPGFDASRTITISCAELFSSPKPSLPLARLLELAPQDISPDLLDGGMVPVDPATVALKYQFTVTKEILEEPAMPEPPAPEPDVSAYAPPVAQPEAVEVPPVDVPLPVPVAPPVPMPSVPPPAPAASAPPVAVPPPAPQPRTFPIPRPAPTPEAAPTPAPQQVTSPSDSGLIPTQRKVFRMMPILRRKGVVPGGEVQPPLPSPISNFASPPEPVPAPPAPPAHEQPVPVDPEVWASQPSAAVEPELFVPAAPEPEPTQDPLEPVLIDPPAEVAGSAHEPMAAEMEEPAPEVATPQPEAIFHVEPAFARPSRAVSARAPESNSQARLQEIFMTEDHMSVERVLELCGGLPGIRSCILARGSNVLASHNVPSGIDLVSLTANAAAMLASIRSSSMRMGLGAIPAVTVHSEKGPVSFFHADDLVMLVLHADRGFVPGVRERLHDVVIALGTANLPVPLEGGSE